MNMIPFQFQTNEIRVIEQNGEPWFVAKDVAKLLGYAKPRNAISSHCKAALKQGVPTNSGIQEMQLIPERDVYRLIMRSKLPAAEKFEDWVVADVLPSIRKKGAYVAQPSKLSRMDLLKMAMEAEEENLVLKKKVQKDIHKIEALNRLSVSEGSLCLTDSAKHLQIRRKDLLDWMSHHQWIYKRAGNKHWVAYQNKLQQGLLEHKVHVSTGYDGREQIHQQVKVTPKGLVKLAKEQSAEAA